MQTRTAEYHFTLVVCSEGCGERNVSCTAVWKLESNRQCTSLPHTDSFLSIYLERHTHIHRNVQETRSCNLLAEVRKDINKKDTCVCTCLYVYMYQIKVYE